MEIVGNIFDLSYFIPRKMKDKKHVHRSDHFYLSSLLKNSWFKIVVNFRKSRHNYVYFSHFVLIIIILGSNKH